MKHYGDITKINGANVEAVDIITGGSPCQDLSVAGKRAGLAGERSGLFMEQIRIIKEMREHDRLEKLRSGRTDESLRPRFMVWENVPGAFSSNKGEDFRAVLEETARVKDKGAVIPGPTNGKWTPAGFILADGWSIAWRVHDAQFWGVPQRRKRIALVADFDGGGAPEILFERKGVSRDFAESREQKKDLAGDIGKDPFETIGGGQAGQGYPCAMINQPTHDPHTVYCLQGNGIDRADTAGCNGKGWRENQSYTLNTIDRPAVMTYQEKTGTLNPGAHAGSYNGQDAYNDLLVVDSRGGARTLHSK